MEAALPLLPGPLRPLVRAGTRVLGAELLVETLYSLFAWRTGDPCGDRAIHGAGLLGLLGEREAGFQCLERAVDSRYVVWLKVDPLFDSYRDDPRFGALLARVGLED